MTTMTRTGCHRHDRRQVAVTSQSPSAARVSFATMTATALTLVSVQTDLIDSSDMVIRAEIKMTFFRI